MHTREQYNPNPNPNSNSNILRQGDTHSSNVDERVSLMQSSAKRYTPTSSTTLYPNKNKMHPSTYLPNSYQTEPLNPQSDRYTEDGEEEIHAFEGISGQDPLLSPHNNMHNNNDPPCKSMLTKRFVIGVAILVLTTLILLLAFAFTTMRDSSSENTITTTCDIFCTGQVLAAMQTSGLFNDSKSFVDMPLKYDPAEVSKRFNELPNHNQSTLALFLEENFEKIGHDVLDWVPHDHSSNISLLSTLIDPTYVMFAQRLNDLWQQLGKQVSPDVYDNPTRHTLLPLLHPYMVVPGGRFREFYYWDSYWIVRGLLICDMTETARYIIENLANFVSVYGYVPNGSRQYYLTRSQPPFLSYMVDAYYQATSDIEWLRSMLPLLDKEYNYYMTIDRHAIKINSTNANVTKEYVLNRYQSNARIPRPESYVEDQMTANLIRVAHGLTPVPTGPSRNNLKTILESVESNGGSSATNFTENDIEQLFSDLTASAETGWDFSSRWFEDRRNLSTAFTSHIIPVDLNAILYGVEVILSKLHNASANTGNLSSSVANDDVSAGTRYMQASEDRIEAIEAILWSSASDQWQDYNWKDQTLYDDSVYLSNYIPLWTKCYPPNKNTSSVIQSLLDSHLVLDGGLVTSIDDVGQQWDYPNAWPPLQHMVIEGISTSAFYPNPKIELSYNQIIAALPSNFTDLNPLYHIPMKNYGTEASKTISYYLAARWLYSNFIAANQTQSFGMWEKYYAPEIGVAGSKGEYTVQLGFGWTNGVALIFLQTYGSILEFDFTQRYEPPFHGMHTPTHTFTINSLDQNEVLGNIDVSEIHLLTDAGEELALPDFLKREEISRRLARQKPAR